MLRLTNRLALASALRFSKPELKLAQTSTRYGYLTSKGGVAVLQRRVPAQQAGDGTASLRLTSARRTFADKENFSGKGLGESKETDPDVIEKGKEKSKGECSASGASPVHAPISSLTYGTLVLLGCVVCVSSIH